MKSIRKKIENIVKQINDNRIIVCEKRSGYNTYISGSTGVLLVHYGSAKETLDNLSKMVQF